MSYSLNDPRYLFLRTCQELVHKSRSAEPYDKLRMSGLLRHLLMGEHSLLRQLGLPEVEELRFRFREPRTEDAARWETPLGFDPTRRQMAIGELVTGDLERFLSARIAYFGEWFTVGLLLDYCDHVLLGGRSGAIVDPSPEAMEGFIRAAAIGGAGPLTVALHEITGVTLNGLLPLAKLGDALPKRATTERKATPAPPPGCPFHRAGGAS